MQGKGQEPPGKVSPGAALVKGKRGSSCVWKGWVRGGRGPGVRTARGHHPALLCVEAVHASAKETDGPLHARAGLHPAQGESLPKGSEGNEEKEKKDEKREEKKEGAASTAGSLWQTDGGDTAPSWEAPI